MPAPLTGRLVDPAIAARHPIAVMIDDLLAARPQAGLNEADVVWHAPAEGGVPRYMAIYQSRMSTDIGPVRSARVYYVLWAAEWRAMYAHSGGSPQALALLRRKGGGAYVYDANEYAYGGSFERIGTRFAPHNLYTDAGRLRRLGKRLGARDGPLEPVWTFAADAPLETRPTGGRIKVPYPYNTIVYDYDRESNTYPRRVTGEKRQTDTADGQQVAPRNVVVMTVNFIDTGDSKRRLEGEVVGSGKATISTNGRTIQGTWRKADERAATRFFDADGRPVTLTIGQTFIQVVRRGSKATYTDGTDPGAAQPSPSTGASPSASASPSVSPS
ncbi:MAG: DUF3048 domain-containing protein [Chloroflexi bacterium]|nr:DUF3048 domain-containing protein [Chloroflexota bacterium]